MTSDRKIRANRANARASTGPKSAPGRARAARNARRHGLSLPVYFDPLLSEQVKALGRDIVGTEANAEIQELAHRVAEAQIDLCRIRRARQRLLSGALCDPHYVSPADERKRLKLAVQAEKLRAELGLIPHLPLAPFDTLHRRHRPFLNWLAQRPAQPLPEGPQKFATILSDMSKKLAALDRYERRALSRRKFAIRAFDAARSRALTVPIAPTAA